MTRSSNLTSIKILTNLRDKLTENFIVEKSLGISQKRQTRVERTSKKTQICSCYSFKDKTFIKIIDTTNDGEDVSITHESGNLVVVNLGKANML